MIKEEIEAKVMELAGCDACTQDSCKMGNGVCYHYQKKDDLREMAKFTEERMIEKACWVFCDVLCEKGASAMCFFKHDNESQVKKDFDYMTCKCNPLQTFRFWIKNE